MSETIKAALISSGTTLLATLITQLTTVFILKLNSSREMQQKEYQLKRDNLHKVYTNLVSIINLFPDTSPNNILKCVEYPPNYSLEHFDSIIRSLDYQIEDYQDELNRPNIKFEQKNNIDTQISNREYAKKNILEIRDRYYNAKDKYKSFCETEKAIFDFYAGQDVQNCLVEFEVVIHNVFVSGYSEGDNTLNNIIKTSRQKLINSIRNDIGTTRNIKRLFK